jgi:hypothetical protein
MDFNKIIAKLKDIDPTNVLDPKGVSQAAIEANRPKVAVQLDEAAQLRVLSGRSTMIAESALMEKKLTTAEKDKKEEVVKSMKGDKKGFMKRYGEKGEEVMHATATKIAKKKAESVEILDTDEEIAEVFDADAKVGDKKKTSSGVATKTATGMKHEKTYGKDADGSEDDSKTAKKKKVKEEMKVGDKKKSATGGTIEKTATGIKHTGGKNYSGKTAEKEEKKNVKEAVGQEGPADLLAAVEEEINNPGRTVDNLTDVLNATFGSDRSPEFKKARAVIGKYLDLVDNAAMGSEEDGIAPMRGGNIARHIQQYDLTDYLQQAAAMLDKAVKGPMKEGSKPDFLDMDKDGDKKEPMKKAVADKKAGPKKGVNPFAKKAVKESVDYQSKLTFIKCLQAVKESQGQLQIDPMDKALWTWAQRVAASKAGSGNKADAFAAKVYESYGGEWSLYNTLTETK